MSRGRLPFRGVAFFLLLALTHLSAAETPPPARASRTAWTLSEVVLDNHVTPPTRQEMFLGAARGLLAAADVPAPADLSRRVSGLATEEQFAALLADLWPRSGDPQRLESAVAAGLLEKVPGSAHFFLPRDLSVRDQVSGNRYVGTGIQVRLHQEEKVVQIVTPFRGGPAHRAGARPGDLILEVDGKTTRGHTLAEVVEMLRGNEGSEVSVVVRQPDADEKRTLKMVRSVVPFENVFGFRRAADDSWVYRIDPSGPVAYAAVRSLTSSTLHELRQLEKRVKAEGAGALVLDFRSNPGGALEHAALVADGLLDGGTLWKTRDRDGREKEVKADRDCLFRDLPLAVLVGPQTGPGMTQVAAALQDNGRAVVVGEPARADGYVRTRVDYAGGASQLELPTAVLVRAKAPKQPAGEDQLPGDAPPTWVVVPDQPVASTAKQREALEEWLHYKDFTELPRGVRDEAPEDPPLARAVEVLRAALQGKGSEKSR
jgi:carboxyl-terminal processing protease